VATNGGVFVRAEPGEVGSGPATPPGRSVAQETLVNSLGWLIRMRAFGAGAVAVATAVAVRGFGLPVPELDGYAAGLAIFAYNLLFRLALKRERARCLVSPVACEWFARVQMAFDWAAMAVVLHLSGGIESPALLFFLFHIAIASLLLPHDRAFLYVTLAPIVVGVSAALEASGLLRHVGLFGGTRYADPVFIGAVLAFFTCATYVMAYLAMSITRRLRRREREIEQLCASLTALDRQKSEFIRTVTHELRSPVGVVEKMLSVLEDGHLGALAPAQADFVTRARRRLEFLHTLVDDLLDLAASKSGSVRRPELANLPFSALVQEVCGRFAAVVTSKGVELRVEAADDTLLVFANAGDLDILVNNIVGNAVKYTPRGEVRVALTREDDAARLVVSDTGIGVPKEALPLLFKEFFRARNARAVEERGTGLGLAIVKGLVDRYAGSIEVASIEGQGTTFTVRLPLADAGLGSA
jgi:signal transduction histidine kinase